MSQKARLKGARRQKQKLTTAHYRPSTTEPTASMPDGKTKRVFKLPRREESRYSLQSGKVGSRLSLQEVFNRAHAEYEGCSYDVDEPLSQADVYGINRDIRCHLYDIKKLERGQLTFREVMRLYPVFMNDLRGIIEKKWDMLQRCKAQWGVDWAIQRVLQRDRIYPVKDSSQAVRSTGNRGLSHSRSQVFAEPSQPESSSDECRKESSTGKEREILTRKEGDFSSDSQDSQSETDNGSEGLSSDAEGKEADYDEVLNEENRPARLSRKSISKRKKDKSSAARSTSAGTYSAMDTGSGCGSPVKSRGVQQLAEESSERRTISRASHGFKTPRRNQKRKRKNTVSDSEDVELPNLLPKRQTKRRRMPQRKTAARRARKK